MVPDTPPYENSGWLHGPSTDLGEADVQIAATPSRGSLKVTMGRSYGLRTGGSRPDSGCVE